MQRARKAFRTQRRHAAERGIHFFFTYEGWLAWWFEKLGPDWLSLRGHHTNKYVMARNGDQGPYAPWNVKCITHSENLAERKANGSLAKGERNGTSKLTDEQVIEIFTSETRRETMARKFGVNERTIASIRCRTAWQHITASLSRKENSPIGEGNGNARLTVQQVKEIFLAPGTLASLGRKYGVTYQMVSSIKKRKNWKHITASLS